MSEVKVDPARWESVEGGNAAFVESWLACEGDHIRAGQLLGKARLAEWCVDIEALHDGVLDQICVPAGDSFVPGEVLAHVVAF